MEVLKYARTGSPKEGSQMDSNMGEMLYDIADFFMILLTSF
jgi:hypothetical protein